MIFSIDVSYSTNSTTTQASTIINEASSIYTSYIGVSPSKNDSSDWAEEAMKSPMPIYYKIAPISNLLTTTNLPNCSETLLKRVQKRMNYYMARYCNSLGSTSCSGATYDQELPQYSVISKSGNMVTVSCSVNQSMIGIGFKRTTTSGSYEKFPIYKLISTKEGECYDEYGLECYAICTSAFTPEEVKIVDSANSTGYSYVECPSGYKVSGCGLDLSPASTLESYPTSYMVDTSTCLCYSYYKHQCQAICIPQKTFLNETYEIVIETSSGNFNAACPGSLQVLGCGYKASSSGAEYFWYVYPQENSCVCYNYYGATCYAVCADIFQIGTPNCSKCASGYCSTDGCTKCETGYFLSKTIGSNHW